MKTLSLIAVVAAGSAFASAAAATDCSKWSDHKPGYCGVLSTEKECASSASQVPGKCAIPTAAWYVNTSKDLIDNRAQSVMAPAGSYELRTLNGSAVTLVAQGGGNLVAQGGGNLVAQGGGNLVAQGGGNLVAQGGGNLVAQGGGNLASRSLMSAGGKKVFVLQK